MATVHKAQDKRFLTDAVGEDSSITWSVSANLSSRIRDMSFLCDDSEDSEEKISEEAKKKNIFADLTLRDCYHKVHLSFDMYGLTDEELSSRLAKVDNLIESLESFKQAIVASSEKLEVSE